jgi:hypothetical protein
VVAQPTPSASAVSFTGGSIVIPPGLASGILSETVPAVDEQSGAPWDVGPAHLRLTLQDYVLQGTFFQEHPIASNACRPCWPIPAPP